MTASTASPRSKLQKALRTASKTTLTISWLSRRVSDMLSNEGCWWRTLMTAVSPGAHSSALKGRSVSEAARVRSVDATTLVSSYMCIPQHVLTVFA